jgi:hypothetical protein
MSRLFVAAFRKVCGWPKGYRSWRAFLFATSNNLLKEWLMEKITKRKSTTKQRLIIAIVGMLMLAVAGLVAYMGYFSYTTAKEIPYECESLCFVEGSTPKIDNVVIRHNEQGIIIRNDSDLSWDCDIIAVSGYFAERTTVDPHGSVDIAYRDFTSRNVRLDTSSIKPDNLSLQCTIDGVNRASKFMLN